MARPRPTAPTRPGGRLPCGKTWPPPAGPRSSSAPCSPSSPAGDWPGEGWAVAVAGAYLTLVGTVLTVIDWRTHRLPDRIVLAGTVGVLLMLVAAAATGDAWPVLGRAVAAALVSLVGYFVLALLRSGGLGLGDVKLGGLLGLWLGWFGWPHVLGRRPRRVRPRGRDRPRPARDAAGEPHLGDRLRPVDGARGGGDDGARRRAGAARRLRRSRRAPRHARRRAPCAVRPPRTPAWTPRRHRAASWQDRTHAQMVDRR